jgi:UDP-2,4-diacetamido-2,4,6-trideoxy-beta-L-altropyranose hydrolase
LLRPEFARARARLRRRDGSIRRAFIFMSGGDTANVTQAAMAACVQESLLVDVVVGAAYPHLDALNEAAAGNPRVRILRNTRAIAQLMADADIAIGAPSSASWERCALGLPTVLVTLAENQRQVDQELARLGAAMSLGWFEGVTVKDIGAAIHGLEQDSSRVRKMSEAAFRITDGNGALRVLSEVERLTAEPSRRLGHG